MAHRARFRSGIVFYVTVTTGRMNWDKVNWSGLWYIVDNNEKLKRRKKEGKISKLQIRFSDDWKNNLRRKKFDKDFYEDFEEFSDFFTFF